jgi:hypothetical protein
VLSGLLDEAVKILRTRQSAMIDPPRLATMKPHEREEVASITSLLGKHDAIFAATQPVPRNAKFFNSNDEDR